MRKKEFIQKSKVELEKYFEVFQKSVDVLEDKIKIEQITADFTFNFWQNIVMIMTLLFDEESPVSYKLETFGISFNTALDEKDRKILIDEFRDMLKEKYTRLPGFLITHN